VIKFKSEDSKKIFFSILIFSLTLLLTILVLISTYAIQNDHFYVSQRETQTAITSYYLKHKGYGMFKYITPVMGYPWAIPMEFPLYQFIVAQISDGMFSLDDSGRLVSFIFFMVSLLMVFKILRRLYFSRDQAFVFLSLLASSPIYVVYSLSFTIETTALCFGLLYLYFFILHLQEEKEIFVILAAFSGILCALSKITTWVIMAGVIGIIIIWSSWRKFKTRNFNGKVFVYQILVVLFPFVTGLLWTIHSDILKAQNPLGASITSSALGPWNFGTFGLKTSISRWFYFLGRSFIGLFGIAGLVIPFMMVYRFFKYRISLWSNKLLLLSLSAFFLGPLIFTNVFFEHDYYIISTGIFLIFFFYLICQKKIKTFWAIILIFTNLVFAYFYLNLKQENYKDPINRQIVSVIQNLPDDYSIIVFGAFFDSFIPYYSHKKALQMRFENVKPEVMQTALNQMKNQNVGVIIVKSEEYETLAGRAAVTFGLEGKFEISKGIVVFFKKDIECFLNLEKLDLPAISDEKINDFLREFNSRGTRLIVNFNKKNLVSIIYYSKGNFYLFDFKKGFNILHGQRYKFNPKKIELKIEDKQM